jgi:O-antigen/teichoic acid export membrane protein
VSDQIEEQEAAKENIFKEHPVASESDKISRLSRIFRIATGFFLNQGVLQGVGVLANLYLVRALSVEAYAQFGFSYGFQATVSTLMDLGIASTIVPLVGERFRDAPLVGRYVRAAMRLRNRVFWILSPVVAIAFLFITSRHHWGITVEALLLFSVLLSLYSSGKVAYFSAPLFLYRRLRGYYLPQTLSGIARLVVYIVLGITGWLNAPLAALLNAFNVTLNGWLIGRESRRYIQWPVQDDPSVEKEVVRYILPATPAIILGAFHGQIALFLISIFGGTTSIAQVAALTRMSQLFAVLMTFNVIIVEPYIARLSAERLLPIYVKFVSMATLAAACLATFSFLCPQVFLWLLGPKYLDLKDMIGWVILTACINYIAGLMWIMNRSRKWVFWRGTWLEIALVLVVQIGYLIMIGVRTTQSAVFFNFASSFCYLLTHAYIAIYGYSQRTPTNQAVVPSP